MHYKTPEIILWGKITVEYGFATSLSSEPGQIYFQTDDHPDHEFSN